MKGRREGLQLKAFPHKGAAFTIRKGEVSKARISFLYGLYPVALFKLLLQGRVCVGEVKIKMKGTTIRIFSFRRRFSRTDKGWMRQMR